MDRAMPRLPRLQYPGAIYHIVTRGDGRRRLFHDDGHYERFTRGLAEEVVRSGWIVIAYCWMPNHDHALIKTPQPNLCRGMQHWLSGYANWYARRNRRRRRMHPVTIDAILEATARQYGTSADTYGGYRSRAAGRDVAAMLCRRWTTATP